MFSDTFEIPLETLFYPSYIIYNSDGLLNMWLACGEIAI